MGFLEIIQPGVYPAEMNNGAKSGIRSDKPHITAAYGDAAAQKFNDMGAALFGKMAGEYS